MARWRSRSLPRWARITYGRDGEAWERAKRECRGVLYEWARSGEPHPWHELIDRVTAIQWPPGDAASGQLGYLVGQVALEELSTGEDRPILSAMGFNASIGDPGAGFWALFEDLADPLPTDKQAFWMQEVRRCHQFYGSKATPVQSP